MTFLLNIFIIIGIDSVKSCKPQIIQGSLFPCNGPTQKIFSEDPGEYEADPREKQALSTDLVVMMTMMMVTAEMVDRSPGCLLRRLRRAVSIAASVVLQALYHCHHNILVLILLTMKRQKTIVRWMNTVE
ncbi:MAG: hypothetical protein EBU96_05500 [Actinobacteria bacterium]|nr:hypothetical protein [Actinomycetota bacterium]